MSIIQNTGFEFPLFTFLLMCCFVSPAYFFHSCSSAWICQTGPLLRAWTSRALSSLILQQFCQASNRPVKLNTLLKLIKKRELQEVIIWVRSIIIPSSPTPPVLCSLSCLSSSKLHQILTAKEARITPELYSSLQTGHWLPSLIPSKSFQEWSYLARLLSSQSWGISMNTLLLTFFNKLFKKCVII